MNNKGFTLVELLATLVILAIVIGITISAMNLNFGSTKEKTEDVFVDTIRDAIDVYLDSDAKDKYLDNDGKYKKILKFTEFKNGENKTICINKKYGKVKLYNAVYNKYGVSREIIFSDIMSSKYKPLNDSDFVNPANEDVACNKNAIVNVYRDDDYVYYYSVLKKDFNCLLKTEETLADGTVKYISISNLPETEVCDSE